MLKKKEIGLIIIISIIIGFLVNIGSTPKQVLMGFVSIFLILIINFSAKKIAAFYLDSEIEIDLWRINRYGFKPHQYFREHFPAGIIIPLISKIILFPLQNFVWMAALIFESKPLVYRASKRFGLYTFSEMTEYHTGIIAATGIIANIIFATISYLIGFPPELKFVQLSIIFSFFNLIPISDLDGNKIFFGSRIIWSILTAIILIGVIGMFIII